MTAGAGAVMTRDLAGLELVARRTLLVSPLHAFFRLHPGDRPLVKAGEAVGRGQPLLEHHRDPRTIVVAGPIGEDGTAGPGQPRDRDPAGRRAAVPQRRTLANRGRRSPRSARIAVRGCRP